MPEPHDRPELRNTDLEPPTTNHRGDHDDNDEHASRPAGEAASGAPVVDDTQLQDDIVDELRWDNAVNAAHIGVAVSDGAFALTGHVDSYAKRLAAVSDLVLTLEGSVEREFQRRAAEHGVEGIRGVRWVRNLIVLSAMPAEPDIDMRIQEALVREAASSPIGSR